MCVVAQLDGLEIPGDVVHRAQLDVGVAVDDVVLLSGEDRDVAVVQIDDRARMLHDGRRIGRDEVLILADPEQNR